MTGVSQTPADFLIDAELDQGLYMNLDPFEYFMETIRCDPAYLSMFPDLRQYETPTETATRLLGFPHCLPTELKGIAV